MKKLIMIFMVLALVASMSISVLATAGGFIESPSGKPAPQLVAGANENEECEAQVIITAYSDRDQMTEAARKNIEAAYAIIVGTEDLGSLNPALAEIAENLGVDTSALAVSDLFDVSATECNGHAEHGHFDITLKSDTLKNFACLLKYHNEEWSIVENAEVTNNGEHLEFDEDELTSFAIVVNTGDEAGNGDKQPDDSKDVAGTEDVAGTDDVADDAADGDDSDMTALYIAAAVAILLIILLVIVFSKKKNKK